MAKVYERIMKLLNEKTASKKEEIAVFPSFAIKQWTETAESSTKTEKKNNKRKSLDVFFFFSPNHACTHTHIQSKCLIC